MAERTDEQLLLAYREGESGAFRALIERHQDALLRFLIRFMGDRAAAEDVFQEAFLQVHLSADSFDVERRFKPWLFTIAANKGRDHLRKHNRRPVVDLSAPVGSSGEDDGGRTFLDLMEVDVEAPGARLDARERDTLVQRAVDAMPEHLREILLLAYFQRLSYQVIADNLGIPLGTVKSRLHAAVASFAKKWSALAKSYEEEDGKGTGRSGNPDAIARIGPGGPAAGTQAGTERGRGTIFARSGGPPNILKCDVVGGGRSSSPFPEMQDPFPNPTPLCPADVAAVDALVASGFDAGRAAEGAESEVAKRVARVAGLLSALDPSIAAMSPADARLLTDVTIARTLRASSARAEALTLCTDDAAAVDALLSAGWDPEETPARHAARARKIASALTGLSDPSAAERTDASSRARLLEATLARVQREIDKTDGLRKLDPVHEIGVARGRRFTRADVVSIAAMLVLTFGVLFPMANRWRQDARLQECASNLQETGVGFGMYANDHQGHLPVTAAGFAGGGSGTWWNVGESHSHSANLFTLAREKYVRSLRVLTCPGNSAGNPTLDLDSHTDWRNPDEVSYSYQLPPAAGAPLVWSGRIRMVVLSDRSPVVERARAGESFDPMASSTMHKGRGQNVLVSDGTARLLVSPELPNGDNIWLPRSQERSAHPSLRGMERPDGVDDAFVGP